MRDAASGVSTLRHSSVLPGSPAAHRSAAKMIAPEKECMMNNHEVVSREEWAAARAELLACEKGAHPPG
jgi:hypothetical protein